MTYEVDRQTWAERDIFSQLANIGAEVGRTITAWQRGNSERFEGGLLRALDLFDATTETLVTDSPHRLREVLRAREVFLGLFFADSVAEPAEVEEYFMQYAVAARQRSTA